MTEPYVGSWLWCCLDCGEANTVTLGKGFIGSETGKVRALCVACGVYHKIRVMRPEGAAVVVTVNSDRFTG